MTPPNLPCPCGKPWPDFDHHDPTVSQMVAYVEQCVAEHGELIPVHVAGRSFLVSRRCIAYHGVTGQRLLSGRSGFREVTGRWVDHVGDDS